MKRVTPSSNLLVTKIGLAALAVGLTVGWFAHVQQAPQKIPLGPASDIWIEFDDIQQALDAAGKLHRGLAVCVRREVQGKESYWMPPGVRMTGPTEQYSECKFRMPSMPMITSTSDNLVSNMRFRADVRGGTTISGNSLFGNSWSNEKNGWISRD